ncbi:hypothetical protein PsAD2_01452 [Pseudovibrio axinellae]|uniref:Uncharacterized protein n=1 Tax=Pseudovibrio axinellae TaxID=989403 RepID=A0A165ZYS8_9HYPH|nr:hypothetical protein [Pseudovibrio axinellae]KZL20409.1 hypothetical protein PsAD2_01452 [Pseudovibrio axinellae]SER77863.1 hypothetical protein SAMN05421798_12229 [Pseudovibrio axinellae]
MPSPFLLPCETQPLLIRRALHTVPRSATNGTLAGRTLSSERLPVLRLLLFAGGLAP